MNSEFELWSEFFTLIYEIWTAFLLFWDLIRTPREF